MISLLVFTCVLGNILNPNVVYRPFLIFKAPEAHI